MSALAAAGVGTRARAGSEHPGDLDTLFSGDGRVTTDFGGIDAGAAVAVQPDGKIVVAGTTYHGSEDAKIAIARYNPEGTPDSSFGGGDGAEVTSRPGESLIAHDLALQPDGGIVVGGGDDGDFMAARYTPSGALDPSFGTGGISTIDAGEDASGVSLTPDGKIVLAGSTGGLGSEDLAVARLDADGDPDSSFSGDGRDTAPVPGTQSGSGVAVQDDGAIVVAGTEGDESGGRHFILARFGKDGGLDDSFSGDGVQTTTVTNSDEANAVVVQPGGKLVVGGSTIRSGADFALARYLPSGALDPSFGTAGEQETDIGAADAIRALAIDPHGDIVAAGSSGVDIQGDNGKFALARYGDDGRLDPDFGDDGTTTTNFASYFQQSANGVTVQSDGRIVAAGTATRGAGDDFAIARYLGDAGSCGGLNATILGTSGDDDLTGTPGPDVIDAGRGDDEIRGLNGNDVICGGKGDDSLAGMNGDDELRGLEGADGLSGGKGKDDITGAVGRDTMNGARGRDKLRGGPGGDFMRGGPGKDTLHGGSGFDNCNGGGGRNRLKGC